MHKGHTGKTQASLESERVGRKCKQEPLLWLLREGTCEAGVKSLRIGSFDLFQWALGYRSV